MTEKTTVNANAVNAQATEVWNKMVAEQTGRIETMCEELDKLENQGIDQLRTAIDEATRMMKSSVEYQTQISNEWRKLALEATRRAAELLTPRA